jgi:hypothetical protein
LISDKNALFFSRKNYCSRPKLIGILHHKNQF